MERIEETLCGVNRVAILGHIHPDGDCVGSCLGLYHYLKSVKPELTVQVYLEEFPKEFLFLKDADAICHDFHREEIYDLCFALDSSDRERLGDAVGYFDSAKKTVCIDHHITNTGLADINVIEASASSASEVLLTKMDLEKVNLAAAECLYLGIVHDTGVFKHSNTSPRTMCLAGELLAKGVSSAHIIDDTFYRKTFVQNKLLGKALEKSELDLDGKMIASVLTQGDMKALGADKRDVDGIIDQLRVTEGVEMAVLLYEQQEGVFKVSLRSNDLVNVSQIAGEFGGGGHVKASGCTWQGDPAVILERIGNLAREQMSRE
ncbi:MAG: bifunctional oligoribonuclease/PAP phosphatase NrnA [Clostridiales bacterium]|nr:bifunctional oligoribonuclease/PAP phosphatase NrnA [Clostridiales bacterium]